MNTRVRAGDILISGGRKGLGERLIHFGTRRGALGIYAGAPLLILSIILQWDWIPFFPLAWLVVSILMLEGRSWADHAVVFVEDGILGEASAIEAAKNGGVTLCRPQGDAPRWALFRVPWITENQASALVTRALQLVGNSLPYRMKLNVAFGLDYVLGLGLFDWFVFRRGMVTKHANVCSVLVWRLFIAAMVPGFSREPRMMSPDDLWDMAAEDFLPIAGTKDPGYEGRRS